MAAIPYVKETVRDYGLGLVEQASMMPLVIGVSSLGALNVFEIYSSSSALRDARGEGSAVETGANILDLAGGPIAFIGADSSIAGTNGSVSGGSGLSVSGEAAFDAHVRVEVVLGGALGTARFRYCLDGYTGDTAPERTYSEVLTVPSGGVFVVPGLGLTLTFSGTLVLNTVYQVDVKGPGANATDLAAAFAVAKAASAQWRFEVVVTTKANGDAAAHALLATALNNHLLDLATVSKYRRGMIAATHEDTPSATVTAFTGLVAIRTLIAYGQVRRATSKPLPGYAFPVTNSVDCFAARAAASLPSTDLKRVRSGPLQEVVKTFHDEYKTGSQLDDVKVSTLRSWEGRDGVWITQGRLKSPSGSDFKNWPLGIVMDIACETAHRMLVDEIGRGVRFDNRVVNNVTYPGTIDDRDAAPIEAAVGAALAAQLLTPSNAEGLQGHVTDIRFSISRTQNVLQTGVLIYKVGILPLGYVDYIEGELGFVVQLPEA